MFERVKVDNSLELATVTVEMKLADGRELTGKFVLPSSKSVFEVLQNPGGFIDFEPFGGERQYIAKSTISSIRRITVPGMPNLGGRMRDLDGFDPHRVLDVPANATWEQIRHAYLELAKIYHPDRYASAELPQEVADYLATMTRRINSAFQLLETARHERRHLTSQRSTPVYETRART